jgi:hypothetical protein
MTDDGTTLHLTPAEVEQVEALLVHDRAEIRNSADDDADRLVRRVYAALNSGRDAAVVQVVLDETDRLRREVEGLRAALKFKRGIIDDLAAQVESRDRVVGTLNEMVARRGGRLGELEAIIRRVDALAVECESQQGQCWNPVFGRRIRAALGES